MILFLIVFHSNTGVKHIVLHRQRMLRYIQDLLKEMDSHKLRSLKATDIMKVRGGGVWCLGNLTESTNWNLWSEMVYSEAYLYSKLGL